MAHRRSIIEVESGEEQKKQIKRKADQEPDIEFSFLVVEERQGDGCRCFRQCCEYGDNCHGVGDSLFEFYHIFYSYGFVCSLLVNGVVVWCFSFYISCEFIVILYLFCSG